MNEVPVNDSSFNNPYQQDKFGIALPPIQSISILLLKNGIETQFQITLKFQSSPLRGGINSNGQISDESAINYYYHGLRLHNARNDCDLNCAGINLTDIPMIKEAILTNLTGIAANQCVIFELKTFLYSDSFQNIRELKNKM